MAEPDVPPVSPSIGLAPTSISSPAMPAPTTLPPGLMVVPIGHAVHAPWYLWAMVAGFLIVISAVGGALLCWSQLSCAADAAGFAAKTVVCRDKQAYALVPMAADVKVLENRLKECQFQVHDCVTGAAKP